MDDEYVSVTVRSSEPVQFSVGDKLEYRGETFEINYDPNLIKRARRDSHGEAFVYENVRLYSQASRLKDVGFKDYVLNWNSESNVNVYSSQGTFQFFCGSVDDLADRIQANLDRHTPGLWKVFTPNENRTAQRHNAGSLWGDYYDGTESTGKTDVNIEADNLSCKDALGLSYSSFDLSFYVTSATVSGVSKNVIIIGGAPVSAAHNFRYGKGNGLGEIERTSDDTQRIVTKLFAYGSEKNIPMNYYANLGKQIRISILHKSTREIILGQPHLILWVDKEWSKSLESAFAPNYSVRLTDGSLTATVNVSHDHLNGYDNDHGPLVEDVDYMYFSLWSGDAGAQAFYDAVTAGETFTVTGVSINKMPEEFIYIPTSYNYPALLSINRLMLPGFPDMSLYAWVASNGGTNLNPTTGRATWRGHTAYFSKNARDPWIMSIKSDSLGVREGTLNFDGSAGEDEICPTIDGATDGSGRRLDEVAWAEQMDDNGFLGEDPKEGLLTFGFMPGGDSSFIDWLDNDGDVTISMKDGACVGREFKMKKAEKNANGDWELTLNRCYDESLGRYFPYREYGSNTLFQVIGSGNTHGTGSGNHFVILGVSMPQGLVSAASVRLLEKALEQLDKKDHQTFTYIPKIDEIYMQHQDDAVKEGRDAATYGTVSLHDTLHAGMQMEIQDSDLNIHYMPFIDVLTIKEDGNNGIPTYDVVLRDEKELTMQQRIQSQIEGGTEAAINKVEDANSSSRYLSKIQDDTAQGFIRLIKGLQVGERFVPGLLGEGGVFRKEADGTTYIEADNLYIRMKAYFDTVEIRKFLHTGGNRIATVAGAKCVRVEWMDSNNNVLIQKSSNLSSAVKFRCFFRANDGDNVVTNDFIIGDQAYCHVTRAQSETMEHASEGTGGSSLTTKHYWRLVIGRNAEGSLTEDGEYWIDLSNRASETLTIGGTQYTHDGYQSGSDIPNAQDDIVQLGNIEDTTRQGAIIEFVTGGDSPSYQIFQGIDEFSFVGKNYISFGYSTQTGRAYMNVYGDFFFGAKPDAVTGESPTYIRYTQDDGTPQHQPKLEIKAVIDGSSPIGDTDTTIEQALADLLDDITDLQSQIDGSIETFFNDYMPVAKTQEGAPANRVPLVTITIDGHTVPCEPYYSWYTADHGGTAGEVNTERLKHLGDIFYDNTSGYAFRFSQNESTHVFEWVEITDSAVIKALRDAAEAYGLADTKNKIFTTVAGQLPPYPWKEGDLWVNATYPADGSIYSNDILKCKQDRTSDGSINDWTLASKYTDDKKVERYTNILTGSVQPSESSEKEIALAAENAIRTALGGNFILDGGLMLMSIIGMRKLNEGGDPSDPDDYTTWAGISGVYDDNLYGGGIAAWYGGGLVDKRNPTTGEYDVANGAKSGFRFDGSGWLADGNINWNAQGAMVIKNIETIYGTGNDSISINELSALTSIFHTETYGSGNITELLIKPQNAYSQLFINRSGNPLPASSYPQDHTINEYSVLNYGEMKARFVPLEFFNALFTAYGDANHTNAINPWTWTDTAAASRAAINNLKILVGTWTEQYLSALGHNSQQGGGGGIGDVTWEALASAGNQQINISHLSSAGVATQSWVRSQLGGSVIRVDVGTDQYFPSGGIVSLPAYPTTLPASDVSAWAKEDTKPTYAYSEISDRPTSWWGASVDANGAVNGSMSNVGDIAFSASGKNIGGLLYFNTADSQNKQIKVGSNATLVQYAYSNGTFTPKLYVDGYAGVNGEVLAKGLELVGSGTTGNIHGGYIDFHYSESASDYTSRIIEKESGLIQLSTKIQTSRIYLYKPNANDTDAVYLECDTDHNVKLVGNFYATGAVSALGSNSQQGSGGGGDVYWSQLTTGTGGQQIAASLLSNATQPLYFLFNEDDHPTITYDGKMYKTVGNILTKSYADGRYYKKIANGSASEVVLADGTSSKLKTINGNSIFGDGDIVVSGGGGGNYLPLTGGTLEGTGQQILGIKTSNTSGNWIRLYTGSTSDGDIGRWNGGIWIQNHRASGTPSLGIKDDGTLWFSSYNVLHSGNCGGYCLTNKGNVNLGTDSPFSTVTAYATSTNLPNGNAIVYNNSGWEYTMLYSLSPADFRYGTVLKWGYLDTYLRIARYRAGTWQSEDWEKISAGYSDTTGKLNTQVSIWGQQFDGSADISTSTPVKTNLVFFPRYDEEGNAGYVGRGVSNSNNVNFGSYLGSVEIFANNGTGDIFINTSHQVGIGTTSPNSRLHVNGRIEGSGGFIVSGRAYNAGDDEGIVIKYDTSGYAALVLGTNLGRRSIFYIKDGASGTSAPFWRYHNGSAAFDILHPMKGGTIALTSDIPTSLPASDVYAWAKASTKPSYTLDEVGDGSTRKLSNYVLLAGDTMTGKLTVKAPILGYNYKGAGANAAAFILDKPNSNMTGIGSHTSNDVIWFGACNADGAWVDTYKQIWDFNGTIKQEGNAVIHAGNIASQTVSSCTGNAGSATKLQTSRTIWGASFDGTSNITGDLMGAGGYIDFQYGDEINRYGGNLYLQHRGGQSASGQGTGGTTTGNLLMCCNGGSVGIGTMSPSYRLHVNGTFYASGNSSIGGTLTVSGAEISCAGNLRIYQSANNLYLGRSNNSGYVYLADTASQSGSSYWAILNNGRAKFQRIWLYKPDPDYSTNNGVYIEYDSNNSGIHIVGGGLYADTYVSALGANSSSGGGGGNYVTLDGTQTITGAKTFNAAVQITQKLTVSNSIDVSGQIRSTNSSISCAHDITGGGNLSMNGTATIAGTATIGCSMVIGATVSVGTVSSKVIQTLNSQAIYIKTGSAPKFVDGTWSITSDMRLKDIINNVGASVDQIANAPIFNYKWKSGGVSIMLGSSAQYWQNVFQYAVEIGPENYLYMDYSSVALASAVMVARKVQNHEDRILELERENEQLRNEIKQLKAA